MKNCPYCGQHETSHFGQKFYGSIEVLLTPLTKWFFYGWVGQHIVDPVTELIGMGIFHALKLIGVIQFNRNVDDIPFERGKALALEASKRGLDFAEVKPFNQSIDLYQVKLHDRTKMFFNLPRPDHSDQSMLAWVDDKLIFKQKLNEAGIPSPKGGSFFRFNDALIFFNDLHRPVVVKPRRGSRNRHTTVLVQNEQQLRRAFQIAKELCFFVIVEEYLYGDLFRGTVINGQLVGVLGMAPAKVTGDGKNTIQKLIDIYNQNVPAGRIPITIAEKNISHLKLQNLTVDSVLPAGQTVPLSEKMGVDYSGITFDCTEKTHPEIKKALLDAAKVVGDPILGFDFICEDVTKSIHEQNFGIIEANGAPFIQLHDDPLYGQPIHAAAYVWDLVS